MTRLLRLAPAALLVLALAACDNPVGYQTDHLEAIEMVVRDASGAEIARTDENARWTGPGAGGLTVASGETLELAVTVIALDGREIRPDLARGLSVRAEWAPEGHALHEPTDDGDRLLGLRPGTTALRWLVWHGTHADFIAPPLTVTVTP